MLTSIVQAPSHGPVTWQMPQSDHGRLAYEINGWRHETGEPRVLARDLFVIPNALPAIMDQLVTAADKARLWSRPTVIRGTKIEADYSFRRCHSVAVTGRGITALASFEFLLRELAPMWACYYKHVVNPYMDTFGIENEIQLLRYEPGDFFKPHVDAIHDNPALVGRRLAWLAFSCAPGTEGGALVYFRHGIAMFPDGRVFKYYGPNKQPALDPEPQIENDDRWRQIMPAAPGSVLMGPADPTSPHWAMEVKKGRKNTLVGWYH